MEKIIITKQQQQQERDNIVIFMMTVLGGGLVFIHGTSNKMSKKHILISSIIGTALGFGMGKFSVNAMKRAKERSANTVYE